jgi:hypothetical protein
MPPALRYPGSEENVSCTPRIVPNVTSPTNNARKDRLDNASRQSAATAPTDSGGTGRLLSFTSFSGDLRIERLTSSHQPRRHPG